MPDNNQYFFQLRFVFGRCCHGNPKKLGTRNWCFSRLDDFYFFIIDDNMSVTGNKTPKGLPVESKDLFVPPLSDLSQGIYLTYCPEILCLVHIEGPMFQV